MTTRREKILLAAAAGGALAAGAFMAHSKAKAGPSAVVVGLAAAAGGALAALVMGPPRLEDVIGEVSAATDTDPMVLLSGFAPTGVYTPGTATIHA